MRSDLFHATLSKMMDFMKARGSKIRDDGALLNERTFSTALSCVTYKLLLSVSDE